MDELEWKLPELSKGTYQLYFGLRHRKFARELMSLANEGRSTSGMYYAAEIRL